MNTACQGGITTQVQTIQRYLPIHLVSAATGVMDGELTTPLTISIHLLSQVVHYHLPGLPGGGKNPRRRRAGLWLHEAFERTTRRCRLPSTAFVAPIPNFYPSQLGAN